MPNTKISQDIDSGGVQQPSSFRQRTGETMHVFTTFRRNLSDFWKRMDQRANHAVRSLELMHHDFPDVKLRPLSSSLDIQFLALELEHDLTVVGKEMRNTMSQVVKEEESVG